METGSRVGGIFSFGCLSDATLTLAVEEVVLEEGGLPAPTVSDDLEKGHG